MTPVAIATQLPPNVSAAFSAQQQFQVIEAVLGLSTHYSQIIYIFFLKDLEQEVIPN